MKKTYIAPCCIFEAVDQEEMIMSSVFDVIITDAAPDTDEQIIGPGTTPGGSEPTPPPEGPIEIDAKGWGGGFFFD